MKKRIRNNDLVLTTVHHNKKCPSCKTNKGNVIHFLHKNVLKEKRLLEFFICSDCVKTTRQRIIIDKAKDHFYLIPIFNSMLQAAGIVPEELSIDQIAELVNSEQKDIEGEKVDENKESLS